MLEVLDPQPGEIVISDVQILRALYWLRRYASLDTCSCPIDEGNPPEPCAYCEASSLIRELTGEVV